MKRHKWSELRKKLFTPEQIERTEKWVQKEVLEINLRAIRELVGKAQVEVAMKAKMTQADISKAEERPVDLLSTLRRYVEALGGELEVMARFGDKQVRLRGE